MNTMTHLRRAGRLGGLACIRVHGNPGTVAGRRRGGRNSLITHQAMRSGFKILKQIVYPARSVDLAELLGILAGDGHIDKYQVTVTTNSDTDLEHARYTSKLFEKLFSIQAPIKLIKNKKACTVVVSSRAVCIFLERLGMARGHKIRAGLRMPRWIRTRANYRRAFVRGLFDTDGCVYVDSHRINGREYKNMGMAFTNRCLPLLEEFKATLESIGLRPTQKTKYTVFLRRKGDIKLYFNMLGSSNPKHSRKIQAHFS